MKLAITHTDFRIYWPPRLVALTRFLREKGHELTILEVAGKGSNYAFAGRQEVDGVDWRCIYPERAMETIPSAEAAAAVADALNDIEPDVVLAGAIAFPAGAGALRWAKQQRTPIVIFDSVRLADVPRSGFVNQVKRRFYRNADAVLIPAPSHAAGFEFWGVPTERIFFGLNVVDNARFANELPRSDERARERREALGLPERFVLAVGRQVPTKNHATLVRAFCEFRKNHPAASVSLVLVGDGPEHERLTGMVTDAGVDGIHFQGFQSQERLRDYYALTSALVLPSLGEPWGLVVNEAMAAGAPVMVSDGCGCVDTLVEAGNNGWRFTPTDEAAMAAAFAELEKMTWAEIEKMGQRSRERIADWSLDRFCEGAWAAAQHAKAKPTRCRLTDRLLLSRWHGRYRSV